MSKSSVNKVVSFVEGTRLECEMRFEKELIESLRLGKPFPAKLVETDDKIYVSIVNSKGKEGYCGFISPNPTDGIVSSEDVLGSLNARRKPDGTVEYEAYLTGLDEKGLRMILELEFTGKTALEEVIARVIREGILDENGVKERLNWIPKGVNEKNIIEIFKNMKKYKKDVDKIPTGDFKFINSNGIVELTIASFNAGKNIKYEGPKASGKNTAIEDIGKLTNRPVYEIQINADADSETLLGSKTIKSTNPEAEKEVGKCMQALVALISGNDKLIASLAKETKEEVVSEGSIDDKEKRLDALSLLTSIDFAPLINAFKSNEAEIVFQPSPLIQAMENDGIIVLDEINTGHPSVMTLLHSVLDDRKRISVPGYGLVKAGPNFRVFCTLNRDYQGTFELNEALESRFVPVVFSEVDSIRNVIKKRVPTVTAETLNFCDKIYKDIKKKVMISEWSSDIINVRGFIDACDLVEWGIDIKTALKNCVANGCTDLDTRKAVTLLIDTIKL